MYSLKVVFAIVAVLAGISAYPDGAPCEVCESLAPQHDCLPQTGPFPFRAWVEKYSLYIGESLRIIVKGLYSNCFRGIVLQVRDQHYEPVGRIIPVDTNNSKTIDCGGGSCNTLTHTNSCCKTELELVWQAENCCPGPVWVTYTIVECYNTTWNPHRSKPIYVHQVPPPYCTNKTSSWD